MKNLIYFFIAVLFALPACQMESDKIRTSDATNDDPVNWRVPDCDPFKDWVRTSYVLGKCKNDCNGGIGFKCGKTRYKCFGGVLEEEVISDRCTNYDAQDAWVPVPVMTASQADSSDAIDLTIRIINLTTAEVVFNEALPSYDLATDPYLSIEGPLRWAHAYGLSFDSLNTYYYFEFEVGDYYVDTTASQFGTAIVDIISY